MAARVVYHGNGRGARRSATNRKARCKEEQDALLVPQRNIQMWCLRLPAAFGELVMLSSVILVQADGGEAPACIEARIEDGDVGEPRPQG